MISLQRKLPSPLSIDHYDPNINPVQESPFSPPYILSPFLADIPSPKNNDLIICRPINSVLQTEIFASLVNNQEKWELLRIRIQQAVASILKDPCTPTILKKTQLNFSEEIDKKKWNTILHKWSQTISDHSKQIFVQNCELEDQEIPLIFRSLKNDLRIEEEVKKHTNFSQVTPEKNVIFNRYRQAASIILREDFLQIYKASKNKDIQVKREKTLLT